MGFAFGFIVLMYGVAGAEPFTAFLLEDAPFMTVMICLVKGVAAGVVPALLYKFVSRWNKLAGAIVAAISAPIMNTGIFIVGCLIISGTISGWMQFLVEAGAMADVQPVAYYLFIGCAGVNFIIEFAINLVLAPAIHRIVLIAEKNFRLKKEKKAASAEGAGGEEQSLAPETEKIS